MLKTNLKKDLKPFRLIEGEKGGVGGSLELLYLISRRMASILKCLVLIHIGKMRALSINIDI